MSSRLILDVAGDRRGSALLVVLLMLGMIAGLAAVLSRSVSTAALEMGAARGALQSEFDLRAGLELAAATASRLGEDMRSADAAITLPDRRISIHMINERGRVDLNSAGLELMTNILKQSGIFDQEAQTLAAAMIEWRGGSASQKLSAPGDDNRGFSQFSGFTSFGTQPSSEQRQAPKQTVGTRFFQHPYQLVSVPGFTKATVKSLLPKVTVASGSDRIDPYIAPFDVLASLPGSSEERAQQFLEVRESNTSRETTIQILGAESKSVTTEAALGWRVTVTCTHRTGRITRGEAVIALTKGDNGPYRVIYVSE